VTTIFPFRSTGGYTVFENNILDYIMPLCSPNEWKILCATIRKTRGWQDDNGGRKKEDWLAISQLMKLTGIRSNNTVIHSIKGVIEKGYLIRTEFGNSYKYKLNLEYQLEAKQVKPKQVKSLPKEKPPVCKPFGDDAWNIESKDFWRVYAMIRTIKRGSKITNTNQHFPIWQVFHDNKWTEKDIPYLQKFFDAWVSRGFRANNYNWLTDWAVAGEVPQKGYSKKPKRKVEGRMGMTTEQADAKFIKLNQGRI